MILKVDEEGLILEIDVQEIQQTEGIEYKVVDSIPNDIETHNYRYSMGNFIDLGIKEEYREKTFEELKEIKFKELETYYNLLVNKGLEYNGYTYDISQEAQEDRRDISDTINDAIATFGEDSEEMEDALAKVFFMPKVALPNNEGVLSFRTVAEWKRFSLAFMLQVTTNSTIYYTIKQKIELAQTEEELNNIVFE